MNKMAAMDDLAHMHTEPSKRLSEEEIEVQKRLFMQDLRDEMHLEIKKPNASLSLLDYSRRSDLYFHTMVRINSELETIDVIFKDIARKIIPNLAPKVADEIIQKNKSVLRYLRDDIGDDNYFMNQKTAESIDFTEPCPCGSGKVYYQCHIK